MRILSLNNRRAIDATSSDEVEVALIRITHPSITEPVRLSTDPTSIVTIDPLIYGTYSTWLVPAGTTAAVPYLFGLVSTVLPDDQEDQAQSAKLVLEVVDQDMAKVCRSINDRDGRADLAVVHASAPNDLMAEFIGLPITIAEGDTATITLTLSRQSMADEPFPAGRMTRAAFPGVNR